LIRLNSLIYRQVPIYQIVDELNQLGHAIADPTRVRILVALLQSELCVCELVDALEISQSTLSSHLRVLRQTGMVRIRKEGRWIYYSLEKRKAALMNGLFSLIQKDVGGDPGAGADLKLV
jgi:ArsR family transcriptional regulator